SNGGIGRGLVRRPLPMAGIILSSRSGRCLTSKHAGDAQGGTRMRLMHTAVACMLAGPALPPPSAAAQDFPSRAIKFVVPFTAGSATDTLARVLGQKLNAAQGWTVVIENVAGASG